MLEKTLTIPQIEEATGIPGRWIRRAVAAGELAAGRLHQNPRGMIRIRVSELSRWQRYIETPATAS